MQKPDRKRKSVEKEKPWTRSDFIRDLKKVIRPVDEKDGKPKK